MQIEKLGDTCKYCQKGKLVMRTSKYGQFLGCNRYPNCAGSISIQKRKSDLEKQADEWLKNNP